MLRGRDGHGDGRLRRLAVIDLLRSVTLQNVSDSAPARLPTSGELMAWRSFLRAHARITRWLEAELIAEGRLSLAAYDVLVQLSESPNRQLRMTGLAEAVLLSRSGITRLVDRLERAGLVRRQRAEGDGRGVVAMLTDRGLERLRGVAALHLRGITRHFVNALAPAELSALGKTCAALAAGDFPATPADHSVQA